MGEKQPYMMKDMKLNVMFTLVLSFILVKLFVSQ